jgi:hypothetical protein
MKYALYIKEKPTVALHKVFRENLREEIVRHPDTFTSICNRSGYSTSYVRRFLDGDKSNPTLFFVQCISDAVGADPLKLLRKKQ